jgi:hypothetical protein
MEALRYLERVAPNPQAIHLAGSEATAMTGRKLRSTDQEWFVDLRGYP